MPVWLQIALTCLGAAITTGGVLVAYGRGRGEDSGELKRIEEHLRNTDNEIVKLRAWRHELGNQMQNKIALEDVLANMRQRLDRIEHKIYNGGSR